MLQIVIKNLVLPNMFSLNKLEGVLYNIKIFIAHLIVVKRLLIAALSISQKMETLKNHRNSRGYVRMQTRLHSMSVFANMASLGSLLVNYYCTNC